MRYLIKLGSLILAILISAPAYAGRSALLLIDNASGNQLQLKSKSSYCILGASQIAAELKPVSAQAYNLTASSDKSCFVQSSIGSIEILSNGKHIAMLSYKLAIKSSEVVISDEVYPNPYTLITYSLNTLSRASDQDLILVRIIPSQIDSTNYANWMWQLRGKLQSQALNQVVFPGTHMSLSYALGSSICHADPNASILASMISSFVNRFVQTQYLSWAEQLNRGTRYFNMDLCYQNEQDLVTHTLVSTNTFEKYLEQLSSFLQYNPHEIIILDLQHLYGYDNNAIQHLLQIFKQQFSQNLISYAQFKPTTKLTEIWLDKPAKNLIIILPDIAEVNKLRESVDYNFVWPRSTLSAPLHNTRDLNQLLKLNTSDLLKRESMDNNFLVSQMYLHPNKDYILKNPSYSLELMTNRAIPGFYEWLWAVSASGLKANILARDWSNGYDLTLFAIQANSH